MLVAIRIKPTITKLKSRRERSFKMAEESGAEINFLSTNTSEIHLHLEQLLQNTY